MTINKLIHSLANLIKNDLNSCLNHDLNHGSKIFHISHIGEKRYLLRFELSQTTNKKEQYSLGGYVNLINIDEEKLKEFCGDYYPKLKDEINSLKIR